MTLYDIMLREVTLSESCETYQGEKSHLNCEKILALVYNFPDLSILKSFSIYEGQIMVVVVTAVVVKNLKLKSHSKGVGGISQVDLLSQKDKNSVFSGLLVVT